MEGNARESASHNRMQGGRTTKKAVHKEPGLEEPRREYTDHSLFCLEYLNTSIDYILAGSGDFTHTIRFDVPALEETIQHDLSNFGLHFSQRIKHMKVKCDPTLFTKDVQEYGDFFNHDLSRAHQTNMKAIEDELREEIDLRMTERRLRRRYPHLPAHMSLYEVRTWQRRMMNEITNSLIRNYEMIDENEEEKHLERNELYREMFNLEKPDQTRMKAIEAYQEAPQPHREVKTEHMEDNNVPKGKKIRKKPEGNGPRSKKVHKRPAEGDESPDGEFIPMKEGAKPIAKKRGKSGQTVDFPSASTNLIEKKDSLIKSDLKEDEVKPQKEVAKTVQSAVPWQEPFHLPTKEPKVEEPMQQQQPVTLPAAIHQEQNPHLPPLPPPEVTASEGHSQARLNPNKAKKRIAKDKPKQGEKPVKQRPPKEKKQSESTEKKSRTYNKKIPVIPMNIPPPVLYPTTPAPTPSLFNSSGPFVIERDLPLDRKEPISRYKKLTLQKALDNEAHKPETPRIQTPLQIVPTRVPPPSTNNDMKLVMKQIEIQVVDYRPIPEQPRLPLPLNLQPITPRPTNHPRLPNTTRQPNIMEEMLGERHEQNPFLEQNSSESAKEEGEKEDDILDIQDFFAPDPRLPPS